METALTGQEQRRLEDLFREQHFRIQSEEEATRDGHGCDAVVDVSWVERRGHGEHVRTDTVRQTVAYFSRPELDLPGFSAQPEGGVLGSLLEKVLTFAGAPTVEFPEQPDFDRAHTVLSFQPETTRRLFTASVIEAFGRDSSLSVRAAPGAIAVYRQGVTVPPAERAPFVDAAREVAERIIESARALPPREMSHGEETVETVRQLPGWIGRQLRGRLVTRRQVDEFLRQLPPRVVPAPIRRFADGSSGFFLIFGAALTVIGGTLATAMLLANSEEIPAFVPYLLFLLPILGVVVLVLALRYRLRRRRILREGFCEEARIVEVKATSFYAGTDRQHDVTFATSPGKVIVRMGSGPASLARSLRKSGQPARLLVDTDESSRGLWIEGWAMDAHDGQLRSS